MISNAAKLQALSYAHRSAELDPLHAIALALIQGITEFLPISSSAHLILPGILFGWPDQGLAFDTAVHLGSLIAVILFFRRDLHRLAFAATDHLLRKRPSDESRFGINLLIASLPIVPVGYLSRFAVEADLRRIEVIALTTLVFGLALWLADHYKRQQQDQPLTALRALAIGIAQCLALIPGVSRSGITITMALLVGQSREQSARISFLISIPAIGGAATLKLWDLIHAPVTPDWLALGLGMTIAGVSAYLCIHWLLSVIGRIGFLPFVIYRILLALLLAWMIF